MKEYVVTFLFTPDFKNVWLIEKQKPEWQKGCLNGIGGKTEEFEYSIDAAIRELKEEAGIGCLKRELHLYGSMSGINNNSESFKVDFYCGVTDFELYTAEDEEIIKVEVSKVKDYSHIENVPLLIEAAIYKLTGHSNFKDMRLNY